MYRASRDYSVPESTLRDRTRGLVDLEVKIGLTVFSVQRRRKNLLVTSVTWLRLGMGMVYQE